MKGHGARRPRPPPARPDPAGARRPAGAPGDAGHPTGCQRLALQKAHLGGFFDWLREVSVEELAALMDVSPSTSHQHPRVAEANVFAALFE